MASGVAVADDCMDKFQALKLGHEFRYVLYKMSDDKTCIVVDEAVKEATLEDFIAKLPENKPRFAVFDFEYEAEGATRNKILFINWAPDAASVRDKMVHASSKDSFRKKLQGVAVEIQATDLSEIDRTTVLDKVKAP